MDFRLLGPLEVTAGDRKVSLGGPKQRTVLALMLVHANRVISTDRLIDEVWGESPPAAARKSLQAYVARLRKAINANSELLRSEPPGYVLEVDASQVDALRFEELIGEARQVLTRDPAAASAKLLEGLGLWRGEPLAGLAYETPSLQAEVVRLEELRLAVVEDRIEADLALGEHRAVATELEKFIAEHPFRERFRSLYMLSLYQAGRQADALRAYQETRRLLAGELGLDPSPELQHLEQRILEQDPLLSSEVGSNEPGLRAGTLDQGRQAMEDHRFEDAFQLLLSADEEQPLAPEDLTRLAEAAWMTGRLTDGMNFKERAYQQYMNGGSRKKASLVAMALADDSFRRLDVSVGRGWLSRAEHLLVGEEESVEHGWMLRIEAVTAFEGRGEVDAAIELIDRACQIGSRFADHELVALSLHDRGRMMIAQGNVDEGMALLEETMVAAVGGELQAKVTCRIFCNMIEVCDKLADYRRAGEWDEAARRWGVRAGHTTGFPGICRVWRAEILRLRGAWAEAEQEARRACTELKDFFEFTSMAFEEIGHIRLGMGDLATAEEAFSRAHQLGRDPQPGLALLRLAEGDTEAARKLIDRALTNEQLIPLDRARLLPALAVIALADDDLEAARDAMEETQEIAHEYDSGPLFAAAAYIQGEVQLAEGDPAGATEPLRRAWELSKQNGLPYEAAKARLLLGLAYRACGDDELAVLELQSAQAEFDRLGAMTELRTVTRLLDTPESDKGQVGAAHQ